MNKQNTRRISLSIVFSILETVAFYIIYIVLFLLIGFIYSLILKFPALEAVAMFLLGDGILFADIFGIAICLLFSYIIVSSLADRFIENYDEQEFSLFLTGIFLLILNVVFAVLNLVYGNSVLVNIGFIITGIAMVVKHKP